MKIKGMAVACAVSLLRGAACADVCEYDANDLSLITMHVLDINDRAGSFCILPDGTYVIGCLRHPALKPTEVKLHHVGKDFRLIGTHVVDVGMPVKLGIEVIRMDGDDLCLFIYNAPTVKLDAKTFAVKGRYKALADARGSSARLISHGSVFPRERQRTDHGSRVLYASRLPGVCSRRARC